MDRSGDSYPYINKLRNLQERPRGRVVKVLARPEIPRSSHAKHTLFFPILDIFKEIWNKKLFIYCKHSYFLLVLNSYD